MWLTLASLPLITVILLPLLWHHAGISDRAEQRLSQLATYFLPLTGVILVISSLLAGEIINLFQAAISALLVILTFLKLRSSSDALRREGKVAQITLAGIGLFLAPTIISTLNSPSGMVTLVILVLSFFLLAAYFPRLLQVGKEELVDTPSPPSNTAQEYPPPTPYTPAIPQAPLPSYDPAQPQFNHPQTPPASPGIPSPQEAQEEQEKPVPGQPSSRTRRGGNREERPVFRPPNQD